MDTLSTGAGRTLGCGDLASAEGVTWPSRSTGSSGEGTVLALDRSPDSDRGGMALALALALVGMALTSSGVASCRGGVSPRLSENNRAVTTWPRAPLSCAPGPSLAAVP